MTHNITALVSSSSSGLSAPLSANLRRKVKYYVDREKSPATLRAYRTAWNQFVGWTKKKGFTPLPSSPEVMSAYFAELADKGAKVSTIMVALAAIRFFHKRHNVTDETHHVLVEATLAGIRRDKHVKPEKKAAIEAPLLKKLLNVIPNTIAGRRDRLIFRMMYMGAFRRSELTALNVSDIEIDKKEMHITVRASKTDPDGKGFVKHIAVDDEISHRLVKDYRAWLKEAKITKGAIFRRVLRWGVVSDRRLSPQSIALLVKQYARKAKIKASNLSGHSFRSGFITSALKAGAKEGDIMDITGHKNFAIVRGYNRNATPGARRAVKSALSKMDEEE